MPDFNAPITFTTGTTITAETHNQNWDALEVAYNASIASILADASTAGRFIVCNASGVPQYVAMSGDATVSDAGVVSVPGLATEVTALTNVAAAYRLVHESHAVLLGNAAAGITRVPRVVVSGTDDVLLWAIPSGAGTSQFKASIPLFHYASADFAVTGRNTRLRIKMQALTNATAPGSTITAGLHSVSAVAGGAEYLSVTPGAAVAGSTAAFVTPAASTSHSVAGADFTPPADGNYVLGVTVTGSDIAANAVVGIAVQLQLHHT